MAPIPGGKREACVGALGAEWHVSSFAQRPALAQIRQVWGYVENKAQCKQMSLALGEAVILRVCGILYTHRHL